MSEKCAHNDNGFCNKNACVKCPFDTQSQLDCEDYLEHCSSNIVPFEFTCIMCNKTFVIMLDPRKLAQYRAGNGKVQDIFPDLSADERELIMSGICGECYDKMFGDEVDE